MSQPATSSSNARLISTSCSERLWELISTAEGWRSWLVDDADVTIAPDCTAAPRATVSSAPCTSRRSSIVRHQLLVVGRADPRRRRMLHSTSSSCRRVDRNSASPNDSSVPPPNATMSCSQGTASCISWEVRFASLCCWRCTRPCWRDTSVARSATNADEKACATGDSGVLDTHVRRPRGSHAPSPCRALLMKGPTTATVSAERRP